MDKKTLLIIGAIIVVIVGALVYAMNSMIKNTTTESSSPSQAQEEKTEKPNSGAPSSQTTTPTPGKYIDYSSELLASASGTKLLFFHAPWCPQCRELEASIKASVLLNELVILKVDYDSQQALRQKYGVTLQTTVVKVNDTGEKIDSYVAYDEPRFAAVQRELLP